MEEFLNQINQDIKNIFQYNIETTKAYVVPTRNDSTLTFPIGANKQGKVLETCVLMIDMRNSTKISRQLKKDKVRLGKIYLAFIYAMADIADEYGYVRNIIGDRLMVVFEPKDCFAKAINCAAMMYTVATKILSQYVALLDFKVGIGIDFGEMLVLKTGIRKKHEEQSEYKKLVWIGDSANTASKLCDFTNKSYSYQKFHIRYEVLRSEKIFKGYKSPPNSPLIYGLGEIFGNPKPEAEYEYKYTSESRDSTLSCEDFAKRVIVDKDGWKFDGNKVTSFNLENISFSTSPILLTGNVFREFKKAAPQSIYLKNIIKRLS
ncbi:MAG: adenylate/guanylate cyclase domain-containing protein [Bacteroidales bacterium]|nr:adenylate/guanylate cyclase domain-containing protein [Bacteroidales bacterium]